MSPNEAEGKDRPGLKDLAKLVNSTEATPAADPNSDMRKAVADKASKKLKVGKKGTIKKKGKQKTEKKAELSPVSGKSTPIQDNKNGAEPTPVSTPFSSPVKPEVVIKETAPVQIPTSDKPLDLSKATPEPEKFAAVDNSNDGFLSVKH